MFFRVTEDCPLNLNKKIGRHFTRPPRKTEVFLCMIILPYWVPFINYFDRKL